MWFIVGFAIVEIVGIRMVGEMELSDYIDFAVFIVLLGLFLFIIFSQTLSMLHRVYIFLHLSFMHWALLQFASKATSILEFKFLLVQTSYLVLSSMSVIFYIFSIYVVNKLHWFKGWKFKISLLPAMLLVALVLFNPNQLFIREYVGPATEKVIGLGPLFYMLPILSSFYIIMVFILSISTYRKLTYATNTKNHISFTLFGIGITMLFAIIDFVYNILFIDRFNNYFPFLSVGMLISACYMTFRINRNNVLNIISMAHRDVVNTMSVGILIIDRDDYIVDMNRHIAKMIELKVGDIIDYGYFIRTFPDNDWDYILSLYEKQKTNRYMVLSYELVITRSPQRYIHVQCHPIIDKTETLLGYMHTVQDTTQMKNLIESTKLQNSLLQQRNAELIRTQEELYEANKKLEKMAITDPLTECYNKRYLIQYLDGKFALNIENNIPFSVVVIDIDHFKLINDKYGHIAGDYVLKYTADKLKNCIDTTDILARFGGEEFVIFMDNCSEQDAQPKIKKLKEEIEKNEIWLEDSDEVVSVTVSIGMVSIDEFDRFDGKTTKSLQYDIMALADRALYEAKNLGRNTIVMREYVK